MSGSQELANTTSPVKSGPRSHWDIRHTPPGDDSDNGIGQKDDLNGPQETISPVRRRQTHDFGNKGDEDELGKLMGVDGEKLLAVVDEIRNIDALRHVNLALPQLVVVGDTSSGKSSLLQALTKLPFPVSSGLCTRFVTETTIHRCGPSEKPGYTIEVKMDESTSSGKPPFPRKEFNGEEWADVLRSLQVDLADAYDQMSPERFSEKNEPGAQPHGRRRRTSAQEVAQRQLLKHRMVVNVRKTKEAHFRVVDVPGLMKGGATEDDKLSEDLTCEYISNRGTIVLAVIQSNSDINNQKAIRLARQYGAIERTIGVITKCDRIEPRDEEKVFDLLRNMRDSTLYLRLGWFAVRNRNSVEVEEETSFAERDKREAELFSGGKWKEATTSTSLSTNPVDRDILGRKCLRDALSRSLYKQVKDEFPLLRRQMRDLKKQTQEKISRMGDSRDTPKDQQNYLFDIQEIYKREAKRSLNGDYRACSENHASKLRYHVHGFNEEFSADMLNHGVEYAWVVEEEFRMSPEDRSLARPAPPIYNWIYNAWNTSIGNEPKHTAPLNIQRRLFQDQMTSWEAKANAYLEKVASAIGHCNEHLFEVACKDESLRAKIRDKLEAQEDLALRSAKSELGSLLEDNRKVPNAYNPEFDQKYATTQNYRIRQQSHTKAGESQTPEKRELPGEDATLQQFFYSNKKVFDIHDWLWSYWQWACPRFMDNVIIQVVERHLLRKNGPLRLFNRRWIIELSDEELEHLAGEDEVTKSERRKLNEKLEGLNVALDKADRVLR